MMKYNSKIFARSICAVMAGVMMVGGLTGCGNDDAVDGRGMRLEKQNGDKTEITGIAEKYREKESKQKKKSLQDNGLSGIFNSTSNDVMYAEEACDVATVAGDTAMVTDASNSMYTEIAYDTREYDSVAENGFVSTADRPLSTFAADRDTASYSNVRSYIESGCLPPDGAVRIEEMLNYFTYDYRRKPEDGEKFSIYTEYSDCPWNKATKLMMVGINTDEIDFGDKKPSNLVFLIDTSGSMYEDNKLPLVQQYTINEALSSMTAEGCTNGGDAIITAYELAEKNFIEGGNNRVILATDGDLNVGLTSESDLVDLITEEKKDNNIFLSVFGFGTDNLKDNKLESLADNGDGNYAFIDSAYEAKKVLVDEMGGTLNTVAKDVKFQIEFNSANVKGYRQIGYENRALADADFANDAVDGGEIGAGHMVTVLYEIVPAGSDFDVPAAEHKYGQDSNQANTSETASQDVKDKSDSAEDYTGELATVNVRYKEPDGDKSSLVSRVVKTDSYSSEMSVDMSAASAVAAYGMILKNSEYVGSADFDMVMALVGGKVDSSAGSGDIIDMQWQGFADMVRQTQNITD